MKKNLVYNVSVIISVILLIACVGLIYKSNETLKRAKEVEEQAIKMSENAVNLFKIAEIMDLYDERYINEMSDDENFYMDAMLKALSASMNDKYGLYITSKEAAGVEEQLSGKYTGIGIVVTYPEGEDYILIEEIFADSPAEKHLKVGDKIYKINNIDAQTEKGILELKGVSTSGAESVLLNVNGEDITIPLAVVNVDVIKSTVENGIATIRIDSFSENSGEEFLREFNELWKENKISNIIFDVRGNTGGDKFAVTQILDRLAPKGELYTEVYKNSENVVNSDSTCVDVPIYILGDGMSASASELFIMSLQDTNNATFVGSQTFGKSTILGYYPLDDGSSVLMSVGYYYPPSDRFIENVGIEPNVVETEDAMAKALELIQNN